MNENGEFDNSFSKYKMIKFNTAEKNEVLKSIKKEMKKETKKIKFTRLIQPMFATILLAFILVIGANYVYDQLIVNDQQNATSTDQEETINAIIQEEVLFPHIVPQFDEYDIIWIDVFPTVGEVGELEIFYALKNEHEPRKERPLTEKMRNERQEKYNLRAIYGPYEGEIVLSIRQAVSPVGIRGGGDIFETYDEVPYLHDQKIDVNSNTLYYTYDRDVLQIFVQVGETFLLISREPIELTNEEIELEVKKLFEEMIKNS